MSDTQVVPEVTLESLTQQIDKLWRRFDVFEETADELKHAWREFRNSNSSRRGLDGGRGPEGPQGVPGHDGRDAVVRIIQADGKIRILDENDKLCAELVAIPGPAGKDGRTPRDGVDGKDGRTPSLKELERLVAEALKSAALKHHEQIQ